jgi:NADH:ubiquinone oxidoreductase subunit F (NADH-binding)/NADH:ubiquinone oxidoreductase subunit E/Pyruvate/2-oxoacid:ferredoxin oxidoreductase delta subunit
LETQMNSLVETELSPIDDIVKKIGSDKKAIIPILKAIQERYNYLPQEALKRVCKITDITPATAAGVSTFYSGFRHMPAGRHFIKVCIGTACHIKGGERVFDAFKRHLNIPDKEDTDANRLFTVEKAACLGCCMLAPAVRIDRVTYGFVGTDTVPHVLKDFLASQGQQAKKKAPEVTGVVSAGNNNGEVRMCTCSSCEAAGAGRVFAELFRQVHDTGMPVRVKEVGCTGVSFEAPLLEIVLPDGQTFRYGRIQTQDVGPVLSSHFQPSGIVKRITRAATRQLEKLLTDETWEPVTRYSVDLRHGPDSFYWGRQTHIVTEYCGSMEPLDLDGYLEHEGFQGLKKSLSALRPDEVIDQIKKSGLRGRGGAGYSTGLKWSHVRKAGNETRYLICNGDEGDPGAFMDRMIMESFPFRVIEGMAIASYAVGASEGYLYIRAEYPLAIRRIREALSLCRERGLIGSDMMDSGHRLDLKLVEGAGAFVCGEETALIASIEGRRGMPKFRPPYPDMQGLWSRPTLVNNVETYALVPWIIRHGPEKFARIGTGSSRGTKTFALAGKILRGGLIEVPMGISLHEIVEEIGGGIQEGKALKAVQIGGPSGGCVPASLIDTRVDYESLLGVGAVMGSGGLVVLDETDCMVDIARYFMTFTQSESCGKCTYCRIGTRCMLEILERLCMGEGKGGDIEELEHLAWITQGRSLCGLGRTAPNPVQSTLKYFRNEYEEHLGGRCPAKKCKALITYRITDDCIGCTRCAQNCPAEAIPANPSNKHEIDFEKCVRCGTCMQVCPSDAVRVE